MKIDQTLICCKAALAVVLMGAMTAHARGPEANQESSDTVTFHADQAYPESVSWSARQKVFFVGSLRLGTIGKVTPTGVYKPFASDTAMFGSGGIKYDAKRNWVWAALCDIGVSTKSSPDTKGKTAAIIAFNATTGKKERYINLAPLTAGGHCANDLAFDPEGNIYVTDSFAPVVYAVDHHFKARVLVRSDVFKGDNFNLNGIAYHPDGYLLVGKHNSGEFFRVTLKPQVKVQAIALPRTVPGADGIELINRNSLVVAQNAGHDLAVRLTTADGWKSARVEEVSKSVVSFPTAITLMGRNVYMLNNRVDTLIDPLAQRVSDYVLQRLPLNDAE
jgi:sugar lactone lactonase YvrE